MKKKKEIQKEHGEKTKEGNFPDLSNPSLVIDFYGIIRTDLIYQAEILTYYMIAMSYLLLPMKEIAPTFRTTFSNPSSFKEFKDRFNFNPYDDEGYTIILLNEINETKFLQEDLPHIKSPSDKEEIKRVMKNCEYLRLLNNLFALLLDMTKGDLVSILIKIKRYSIMTMYHAGLINGYWMAKLKERAKNIQNVSSSSKKKNDIYVMVQDYADKKIKKDNIKKHIPDLMKLTDRGERTIKNILKEIIKQTTK